MEPRAHEKPESERNPDLQVAPPIHEILQNLAKVERLWPEDAAALIPQIEKHRTDANAITQALDQLAEGDLSTEAKTKYYNATSELLQNPELKRLALFLPFETFPSPGETSIAADNFRENYLEVWSDLLFCQDVRANFNDGDVLEPDARSSDPERVVKAAHLTPWLVKQGLVESSEVIDFVKQVDDEILTHSLLDTQALLEDWHLLDEEDRNTLKQLAAALPPQPTPPPPKYISKARANWLAKKAQGITRPNHRLRDLAQPFSTRENTLQSEIAYTENLAAQLNPEITFGVICLGGSRVKGYGQPGSDIDLWAPTRSAHKITTPSILFTNSAISEKLTDDQVHAIPFSQITEQLPRFAALFNTFWVGSPKNIENLQRKLLPHYFHEKDPSVRSFTTERLEQDLLEYRLMHKGYPAFYPDSNPEYKKYPTIDGASAFYETSYRILATKLFALNIFIPKLEN